MYLLFWGLAPEMTKVDLHKHQRFPQKVEMQGGGEGKIGYYGVKGSAVYTGVDSR